MRAIFSILKSSMVWKLFSGFFHSMEKMFPWYGKLCCGSLLVLGLILAGSGCESLKGSRLAVVKRVHWRATASASEKGHGPELALDGKTNTCWRSGTEEPQWTACNRLFGAD